MTSYDIDAVGYIFDNYNKDALKQLSEDIGLPIKYL